MIPYRQLHFSEDAFGGTADQFDPERFYRDKTLSRCSSYRPFEGGSTYCPGRFIARQEVLIFVAIVLERYNIQLVTPDKQSKAVFPRVEERKPCLGVMGPVKGDDLRFKITQRGHPL